jgi:hypothetical protein
MKASALPLVRGGCVGAGGDVADAVGGEERGEVGGAVAAAVVGEDALDGGAVVGVGGDHPSGKRDAVVRSLVGVQLDLGDPGVIVDGDVGVLPADPVAALRSVAQDALSDLPEAAELLDVQVHQLADRGVLIPIRCWPGLTLRS